MRDEPNNPAAGGAVEEPFFTEAAEEEARPVVPLRGAASYPLTRARLPRALNLLLAVILAGAAGAVGGYFIFSGQAPSPVVQESAETTPDTPAPQTAVDNGSDVTTVKNDETPSRPEPPARAEPERPVTNTAETRPRDDEERAEHEREHAVREGEDEARPRREEVAAHPEPKRRIDSGQTVRRREERRVVPRDGEQDGRPKARLVGTITGRSRRY